jgi:hypothetical protein
LWLLPPLQVNRISLPSLAVEAPCTVMQLPDWLPTMVPLDEL